MILVGIIWFVLAFVIGVAAERRGRSGFGWFLLALLLSPLIAGILLAVFPDKHLRALLEEPRRSAAVDDQVLLLNIKGGRREGSAAIKIIGMAVVFAVFAAFIAAIWVGWSAIQSNIQVKNEETKKANDAGFANATDWKEAQGLGLHTEKELQDWRYHQIIKDASSKAAAQTKPQQQTKSSNDGQIVGEHVDLNEANRRLLALSENDRRSLFFVTLNTSGERCPEVVRTFYQGSVKPNWNAIWSVECKGGPSYSILVMSDEKGSTKVLTCGELRAAGGGECFVRFRN